MPFLLFARNSHFLSFHFQDISLLDELVMMILIHSIPSLKLFFLFKITFK